jgi:hypothetical protein
MKRPPELFEFLKPTANVPEKRVDSRSLKYWRLSTPKPASPQREEKAKASSAAPREEKAKGSSRAERRKPSTRRAASAREEAPASASGSRPAASAGRARGMLVLSRTTLAAAAALLVAMVGVAYVVGKGSTSPPASPDLRVIAPAEPAGADGFTVQVFHWAGVGEPEVAKARIVLDHLMKEESLTSLGSSPQIVRVTAAEETRLYFGRFPKQDDATLLQLLEEVRSLEVWDGKEKVRPFASAFIRAWSDPRKT